MSPIFTIEYQDQDTLLEAHCVLPDNLTRTAPAVMVAHDWSGKNAFAIQKATQLAELGYIGFALDMYGKGKLGKTNEEKMSLMQPFMQNRTMLQTRMQAALTAAKQLPQVDCAKMGVIGFCFGGLCALDLARSGADILGAVSFHGLLHAPETTHPRPIHAKILALHGYDDPMTKPQQVIDFGNEMTRANANWQLDMYGHTLHAFTNPEAHDTTFGTVYNQQADHRSWIAMKAFFREVFGNE